MESESNGVSVGSDTEVIKQPLQKMDQQTVPENGTSDNVTEPEVKSAEGHDPNLTNGETVLHNGEKESENKSMEDESKKLNETETENTINDSEKQKDLVTEINEVIIEKSSEEEAQKQDQDFKEQTAASDEAKTENEKSSKQEEEKCLSMDQSESECQVANETEAETAQEKPVEEIVKESPETENSGNADNKEVQADEDDKKETLESNTTVAEAETEDSKQEETDKGDKSDVMEDKTDEKSIVIEEKKEKSVVIEEKEENSIVIIEKEEQITEKSENTGLKKQSESVEETEKVKADSNTPSASKSVSFKDEKVNGNIKEDDKPKDNIQANFGGISPSVREIQVNIAPGKPVSPNNIFSKAKTKFVVSNSNNTMSTPDLAFRNIQRNKAGFYIWRIENMKVVAVPKDQYGNFFKGDSYIILSMSEPGGKMGIGVKIKDVKGSMEMHIHFWLGSETSQDEAGAAAYKTVELDDFLGGAPVQHRETEGHESKTFLNYFKEGSSGVKYLKGGVKSGFNHVDIKYTEHLWKVKGRHHVRVTEEDIGWSSMNDGDVFVLEVPKCGTIFVWNGQNSSRQEKIKGIKYANQLRDMLSKVYHNVVVMESGRESSELESSELKVFEEYLPLNKKSEMQTIEQAGSDAAADKESSVVKLYLCKEEDNKLTMSEVKTGPLKYADLDPRDAFIVDAGASGVWFWKGKEASEKERKEGMKRAMGFVQKKGMGRNTQVSTVVQGAEPPEFQCLFADWPVPKSTGKVYNRNKIARTIQTKFDASSLHSNPKLAAETQMVDDGSGRVEVWRVEGNELKAVDLKYFGEFFAGDCYVIQYTYDSKGSKAHIIYFWLGQNASDNEKGSAALHAVNLDDKLGGVATQIRVVQGKEPDHFLAMFDGKMIIFDEGEKSEVGVHGQRKDRYMLQVRGTSTLCTKSVEVPFSAESLNSNDVFLVITKSSVHIWNGKGCTGDEREMAKKISTKYNRTPEMVFEGQEKAEFWKLLGGKKEYASVERLKKSEEVREPRLFEITNATGRLTAEEIPNFTQSDLDEDDVMLLDAWDCLILWIGQGSNKAEREGAPKLAQEYLNSDPAGRDPDTPILVVKQGFEPPNFTGFFGVWDRDLWSSGKSYEQLKQEAKENNVAITATYNGTANGDSDFGTVLKYSLEELQVPAEELPSGVDPTCRELHLEMPEFQQLFGMDYTSFQALPAWKQANLKKKHKLF